MSHVVIIVLYIEYDVLIITEVFFTLVSSASTYTFAGGHELSLTTGNAGGRLACGK